MGDAVIPASSVQMKTMADGTLRVSVDIEPRHAQAAFVLFGAPGTPMALAALKVGTQIEPTPEPEPAVEPAKGGPLSKWAALRCKDVRFQAWVNESDEDAARNAILATCGIRSRAELDSNPEAAGLFSKHFRRPWSDHCKRMGWNQ